MDYLKNNWKEWLLNIFIMFVVFLIGFFTYHFWNIKKDNGLEEQKLRAETSKLLEKEKEEKKELNILENFSSLNLEAKSVLIKEFNGKEIFSKDKDSILPIASLTKIFNAIIALENKKTNKEVVMTKRALYAEGNYGLQYYERFSLEDAVKYMMIGSVNDIASAISFGEVNITENWRIFLKKMNIFAKENSMNSTIFFSENGLNINSYIMGAYSTAEDITKVIKYFYKKYPEISEKTVLIEDNICSDKKCHYVKNTNIILEKYPEIIFSKTGYTKLAGGSLATIVKIGDKKYTVVILGSGKMGRFNDLEKIILELKKMTK